MNTVRIVQQKGEGTNSEGLQERERQRQRQKERDRGEKDRETDRETREAMLSGCGLALVFLAGMLKAPHVERSVIADSVELSEERERVQAGERV